MPGCQRKIEDWSCSSQSVRNPGPSSSEMPIHSAIAPSTSPSIETARPSVVRREIAARLHREVAFFNIEQWQAHLLDFTDVIVDPLLFQSFGTIYELKKRKSMKLNAK